MCERESRTDGRLKERNGTLAVVTVYCRWREEREYRE